jgi:hypothetical protein
LREDKKTQRVLGDPVFFTLLSLFPLPDEMESGNGARSIGSGWEAICILRVFKFNKWWLRPLKIAGNLNKSDV